MSRSDRLLDLVPFLGGRRSRTLREIVQHFEVSERTAYRDLAALESRHIPVTRDEHGYKLLEGTTLRPLRLTGAERAVLRLALANPVLGRHPHLARSLAILEGKLDAVLAAAEETAEALALATLDRSGSVSSEVFSFLERAAGAGTAVEMLYASLSGGTRRWRGLDPYRLFHRADAWYVVGRCHLNDEPRTFRLDRVIELRDLGARFAPPADFDLDRYLEHTWSVFRGRGLHEVVVRFDASLAPLLEHARHHPGERVTRRADGAVEYRVKLSHLDELARWLVGFGGAARVEAPDELRARVVELAEGAKKANRRRR
jgi:predicted DNA-binding transcriptional regulator YafY